MIPLKNPAVFPRPLNAPRHPPEGRCCEVLSWCERTNAIVFNSATGSFTIVDPAGLAVTLHGGILIVNRLMISFCPFCGFNWNTRADDNKILTEGVSSPAAAAPAAALRTEAPGTSPASRVLLDFELMRTSSEVLVSKAHELANKHNDDPELQLMMGFMCARIRELEKARPA